MKKVSTIFLQIVVVLIGVAVVAFLLLEPQVEGVNAHATQWEIYFRDPFLAYAYTGSLGFFVALYYAFTLLRHIGKNQVFSQTSVTALRRIKYGALTSAGFVVGGMVYLFLIVRGSDDIAGGVAIGTITTFTCVVIATAAAVFEKLLQSAVDIKSENDLTV